jgi:hypothetical protein
MPMIFERTDPAGVAAASALIGDYQTLHAKVDVSALYGTDLVSADGYLKQNAPLSEAGLPLGAAARTGTKQVETVTVVGTIASDGAGNATAVVTAAGMSASPKTVTFAVANNDTAAQVAGKARTALAADGDVNDFFTVGGTGADVILTAINEAANDATMSVVIDDGTSNGLTAATSADTTPGVAPTTGADLAPGIVVEPIKVAADNTESVLGAAADVFVAIAVTGVLNRDVMEDTLGRALNASEIAALTGANSRLVLSRT